jgi:hypothetical protein
MMRFETGKPLVSAVSNGRAGARLAPPGRAMELVVPTRCAEPVTNTSPPFCVTTPQKAMA